MDSKQTDKELASSPWWMIYQFMEYHFHDPPTCLVWPIDIKNPNFPLKYRGLEWDGKLLSVKDPKIIDDCLKSSTDRIYIPVLMYKKSEFPINRIIKIEKTDSSWSSISLKGIPNHEQFVQQLENSFPALKNLKIINELGFYQNSEEFFIYLSGKEYIFKLFVKIMKNPKIHTNKERIAEFLKNIHGSRHVKPDFFQKFSTIKKVRNKMGKDMGSTLLSYFPQGSEEHKIFEKLYADKYIKQEQFDGMCHTTYRKGMEHEDKHSYDDRAAWNCTLGYDNQGRALKGLVWFKLNSIYREGDKPSVVFPGVRAWVQGFTINKIEKLEEPDVDPKVLGAGLLKMTGGYTNSYGMIIEDIIRKAGLERVYNLPED